MHTERLTQVATLLDGAYRYGLDQDDLTDQVLFALHEANEIENDLIRLSGLTWLPLGPDVDAIGPTLTAAADLLHALSGDLEPGDQLTITGYELRLRRLADQVTP